MDISFRGENEKDKKTRPLKPRFESTKIEIRVCRVCQEKCVNN